MSGIFSCNLYLSIIRILIFFLLVVNRVVYAVEFNTNLLDSVDQENIDFEQFKSAGYIVPGQYKMQVLVNNHSIGEFDVAYVPADDGTTHVCFTTAQINAIGLTEEYLALALSNKKASGCYELLELPGVTATGSLSDYSLALAVPQAYMDYVADGWDPPSRWDDGVDGALLDYGLNLQQSRSVYANSTLTNFSAYGVAGVNLSAWRLRADWQGQYSKNSDDRQSSEFKINRVYGYRALPDITAQLKMGEIDMGQSIFDSFPFVGASLTTDENMLPPNLRGYAPEVVGIAKSNAKVVISQQGRIIYETQVASGPFRIQDLSSYVSGTLDVRVEEQDGTVQTFQVTTASIPYLSRPGFFRYKLASGKAGSARREQDGPVFASGEFSWGVSNNWSLFGGALFGNSYSSAVIGVGRDLYEFGAISFDMTHSWASVLNGDSHSGSSYRVNYSKSFDEYRSQVTFAGYRFSERDCMNMIDFIEASNQENPYYRGGQKELYTVILSKQFEGSSVGAYADFTHQTYWNEAARERLSLSLSSSFDVMDWKGLTSSLSAYSSTQSGVTDNGFYLSLNVPFGLAKSLGYSVSANKTNTSHSINLSNRVDERNTYSLTAGTSTKGDESISGFYSHTGDNVDVSVNASYQPGSASGAGLSVNGGITATGQGAALHRASAAGGSRIMIDTGSVTNIPVSGYGPSVRTNVLGKAVVADVSSYYRSQTSIDVNELNEEVDVVGTPVRNMTLTEGAIGYQQFDMMSGGKRMVQLKRVSGKYVPMAAAVFNRKKQQIGMVGDEGMTYLGGLQPDEQLQVSWGTGHCSLRVPTPLPSAESIATLNCR